MAAAIGVWAAPAGAATTQYTNQATFLANIQAGYYLENFNGLPGPTVNLGLSQAFSGNGYSYIATAITPSNVSDSLFSATPGVAGDIALSTNIATDRLTITFTGNPVTAVGGNIFTSDIAGVFLPWTINIQLDSGSLITIAPSALTSFAGFTTDSAISSLIIFATQPSSDFVWPTLDNFYVGAAATITPTVPEPTSMALAGVGLLCALGYARRRNAR